jgi:photosystem I subunit V
MIHSKVKSQTRSTTRGAKVQTKAFSDVNLAISGANAMMLALGRFVFMPYQRAQIEKAGLPTQNGETHFAAGDVKAEEASFLNTTNDPAGFTLIDVMAWGSLGHALGFAALAVGSFSLL